uniref:39S ribosomal protein L33, mitochondrial n=1 Tax=Ascaris lumbricoides TaxID=6252 RepID=A0A0M3I9S5_ASCLU
MNNIMRFFSRYVIVQLASVISGTTRVWVRERAAEKFSGIFYDPASKANLSLRSTKVTDMFRICD